jgi:hypothetical protein
VYVVDALGDAGAGAGAAGDIRYCLVQAALGGTNTITFDTSGAFAGAVTITLSGGQLNVPANTTITGDGAAKLAINGAGLSRVFNITGDNVTLSSMTIENGKAGNYGGGIDVNSFNVTINYSVITGNTSTYVGGAIWASTTSATVTLNRDVVSNNTAGTFGAGMYFYDGGTVVISSCTFANNTANSGCGGLYLYGNTTTIISSAFTGNSAPSCGAIGQRPGNGTLTITDSTIANNTTSGNGGGIQIDSGTVNIFNSTIASNTAGAGGGIIGNVVLLSSTIVANNIDSGTGPDVSGAIATANQSLIKSSIGAAITTNNGTLLNMDPMLSPLANNGGPTQTMAIADASPAKDVGNNTLALAYDQRAVFNRTFGAGTDIGAFEIQPSVPPPTVTNLKIDDGTIQRSMIDSLTVTFSEAVMFTGAIADAFALQRDSAPPFGTGDENQGITGLVNLNATQVGNVVTLTFNNAASALGPNPILGVGNATNLPGNLSLPDGRYTLTIDHTQVVGMGGNMAADYVLACPPSPAAPTNIFRMFGDANGDGAISSVDLNGNATTTGFRQVFGGPDHRFDYNGDGSVANSDFQQFRLRFGGLVP